MSDQTFDAQRAIALSRLTQEAVPLVQAVDARDDIPKGTKHAIVRGALSVAVFFLKGSVKELRGIPDDVLVGALDEAIGGAVSLIRRAAQ